MHDLKSLERWKIDQGAAVRFLAKHYSEQIGVLGSQASLENTLREFDRTSRVLFDSWNEEVSTDEGREYSVKGLTRRVGNPPSGTTMLVVLEVVFSGWDRGELQCYEMPYASFLRVFSKMPWSITGLSYMGDVYYFDADGKWAVKIDHERSTRELSSTGQRGVK